MTKFSNLFKGIEASRAYDPATSLSLAVACDLSYKSENTIRRISKVWGYQELAFIDIHKGKDIDTQGFVMADATDIVCVLRGSDSIEDWFANFQAVRDPGPLEGTKAHEGFQDALYPAVISLTNAIDTFGVDQRRIWLTGHSLGGALCSLYAGMLIENGYPVYGIYTFASPRPGDDDFAVALNDELSEGPHYRVVNEGDVVPHVPPEPFFSHPGRRVILKYRSSTTRKPAWTKLREKMFKVLMDMTGKRWRIASNHQLGADDLGYIARLRADKARREKAKKSNS